MRRLAALALVALLAVSLSVAVIGCGGGGGSQEPAATPAPATPPAEPMMTDSTMADSAMAPPQPSTTVSGCNGRGVPGLRAPLSCVLHGAGTPFGPGVTVTCPALTQPPGARPRSAMRTRRMDP